MFCTNCGIEYKEDWQFCNNCGAKLLNDIELQKRNVESDINKLDFFKNLTKSKFFLISVGIIFLAIFGFIFSKTIIESDNLYKIQIKQPFSKDIKYGFMDKNGEIIIEPVYDFVSDFSEGLASVRFGEKFGFIDKNGKEVIEPKYDSAEDFKNGLARVYVNGKYGYINKQGKYIIEPKYLYVGEYSDGMADFYESNNEVGYFDNKGKIAINPYPTPEWFKLFTESGYDTKFKDGLAIAYNKSNNKYGFIDKKGKYVIPPSFYSLCSFSDGLALAQISKDKYGYIDKIGKFIINPQYKEAGSFSEGLAPVKIGNKWGYINKTGKLIIEPKFDSFLGVYEYAKSFKNGLAQVFVNGKYGYIDKTGKFVIPPEFDDIQDFLEGLAYVQKESESGYIDESGKFVIEIKSQDYYAGNFKNGLAEFRINDKWGYINKKGEFISPKTSSYDNSYNNSADNYEADVYALCQKAVKNNLNNPNTAKFPWGYSGYITKSNDNVYTLNRYVDAENSYGDEERIYFTCKAQITGGSVSLVDLDMND